MNSSILDIDEDEEDQDDNYKLRKFYECEKLPGVQKSILMDSPKIKLSS